MAVKANGKTNYCVLDTASWLDIQRSCPDLQKTFIYISSGKSPRPKDKLNPQVRKYLQKCSIDKNGLLVVKQQLPMQAAPVNLMVIPESFAITFSKSLHVQWDHPTNAQMLQKFDREYFMLDRVRILKETWEACEYPCQASRIIPKEVEEYSSNTKPESIGTHFNADVIKESCQTIFLLRENLPSFSVTSIIPNQQRPTLRETIISLTSNIRIHKHITIRVNCHSPFNGLDRIRS